LQNWGCCGSWAARQDRGRSVGSIASIGSARIITIPKYRPIRTIRGINSDPTRTIRTNPKIHCAIRAVSRSDVSPCRTESHSVSRVPLTDPHRPTCGTDPHRPTCGTVSHVGRRCTHCAISYAQRYSLRVRMVCLCVWYACAYGMPVRMVCLCVWYACAYGMHGYRVWRGRLCICRSIVRGTISSMIHDV
jgi:hypothetical protein